MKQLTFYILCSILIFNACSEPKLRTPDYEVKIAVDGFIEAGKTPLMYLTYSSPFISSYDSIDFVNMMKFNVSAYVITEEKDTIGFTRQTASNHYPPFKYSMSPNDIKVEAGKEYKLLIRKNGMQDITATTFIPLEPPHVEFINFEPLLADTSYGFYKIQLTNSTSPQYFFFQNKINQERYFYPIKFPCKSNRLIEANKPLNFLIKHRKETNLWTNQIRNNDSLAKPNYAYHKTDSVSFKISSISQTSYDVMSRIFLDTEFSDNPFKPASQLPISNVSNGIGHWTGIHSKTYTIRRQ